MERPRELGTGVREQGPGDKDEDGVDTLEAGAENMYIVSAGGGSGSASESESAAISSAIAQRIFRDGDGEAVNPHLRIEMWGTR